MDNKDSLNKEHINSAINIIAHKVRLKLSTKRNHHPEAKTICHKRAHSILSLVTKELQ